MNSQISPPRIPFRSGWSAGRIFAGVLTVWFLVALLGSRDPDEAEAAIQPKTKRESASFSEFPLLDGGTWRLEAQRGKVVLVNLWATWCPPCQVETPDLVQIAHDYQGDLKVVGVSMDQGDPLPIRRFALNHQVPYPIARGIDERSFSLGIPLPTTYVLDRSGKVAIKTTGAIDNDSFRKLLSTLIAEKS